MIQLADVNVLVALLWERHLHHVAARRWFHDTGTTGWATCPVTQTGFVRVSANPAAVGTALAVREAVAVLATLIAHPAHHFFGDDRGFVDDPLVPHESLIGHRQVTDAHLIAMARRHGAIIATFDEGVARLGGEDVRVIAV